ncbi:MAG: acyl carrier protein [Spirochaetota bacterium]|nr:acyl carrier protein [Spirochaetota bacterium]
MASIQDELFGFIKENFIAGRSDAEIVPDESLIDSGIMDSTGILELVMFLEERFSIEIDDEELIPENLDSINNLISFLKGKGIE